MKRIIAGLLLAAVSFAASAQDVSFYTDTEANYGDTTFLMPATPNIPGTYAETIAFAYQYMPVAGQQPGLSYINLYSTNYVATRSLIHYVSHISKTPLLYTVTSMPGTMTGYWGNYVDAAHQTRFPAFGNPVPAVDTSGLLVVFKCSAQQPTPSDDVSLRYQDRTWDLCQLETQQPDGAMTLGALLPPSEYWIVLPFDTACYVPYTYAECSPTVPHGVSGGVPIYSRTALGVYP